MTNKSKNPNQIKAKRYQFFAKHRLLNYFCKKYYGLNMNVTLDKLKRIERLIQDYPAADSVLELTIDKILQREINKLNLHISNFIVQIKQWEDIYKMDSQLFLEKFEAGQMGDDVDFVEWAATLEMKAKTEDIISTLPGI